MKDLQERGKELSKETPKSLDDLKKHRDSEVIERLTILADYSGSMGDPFSGKNREPKWDAQSKAIEVLWNKTDFGICETKLFLFNHMCNDQRDWNSEAPPSLPDSTNPAGGTNFCEALKRALEEDPTRIILMSDGDASFPTYQVEVCKEKQIPVDTIYIAGAMSGDGSILRQISEMTGGQFCSVENAEELMEHLAELETSERLQLGFDPGDDKGIIEL